MTGRLLTMSDPPPPTNPPPGWYPDPSGGGGYRWWDGVSWTETVDAGPGSDRIGTGGANLAPPHPGAADTSPIGQFGPWFSESFRLAVNRAGHFLPMIVIFVLAISVPTSFAVWFALRDTAVTLDSSTGAVSMDYGGSVPWLVVAMASVPASLLLSYLANASITRQAWAVQAGAVEPWSVSVAEAVKRWRRVISYSVARTAVYWLLGGVLLVAVAIAPAFILLVPLGLVIGVYLWVKFAFVGTVAALGAGTDKPFAESRRLSGLQFGPLLGRMLVLAFVAFNMVLAFGIVGAPFTAIAGGAQSAVDPSAETVRFDDLLGANAAVFALGSLFNAIGLGAGYVMSATGTTLLYRNLGGPVEPGSFDAAPPETDAGQPTTHDPSR